MDGRVIYADILLVANKRANLLKSDINKGYNQTIHNIDIVAQ